MKTPTLTQIRQGVESNDGNAGDIMLMQRMAEYFDLELRDERKNK